MNMVFQAVIVIALLMLCHIGTIVEKYYGGKDTKYIYFGTRILLIGYVGMFVSIGRYSTPLFHRIMDFVRMPHLVANAIALFFIIGFYLSVLAVPYYGMRFLQRIAGVPSNDNSQKYMNTKRDKKWWFEKNK